MVTIPMRFESCLLLNPLKFSRILGVFILTFDWEFAFQWNPLYNLCLYIPLLERREVSILSTETEPQLQRWPLDEGTYIVFNEENNNFSQ